MRAIRKSRIYTSLCYRIPVWKQKCCIWKLYGLKIFSRRGVQVFSKSACQGCRAYKMLHQKIIDITNCWKIIVDIIKYALKNVRNIRFFISYDIFFSNTVNIRSKQDAFSSSDPRFLHMSSNEKLKYSSSFFAFSSKESYLLTLISLGVRWLI